MRLYLSHNLIKAEEKDKKPSTSPTSPGPSVPQGATEGMPPATGDAAAPQAAGDDHTPGVEYDYWYPDGTQTTPPGTGWEAIPGSAGFRRPQGMGGVTGGMPQPQAQQPGQQPKLTLDPAKASQTQMTQPQQAAPSAAPSPDKTQAQDIGTAPTLEMPAQAQQTQAPQQPQPQATEEVSSSAEEKPTEKMSQQEIMQKLKDIWGQAVNKEEKPSISAPDHLDHTSSAKDLVDSIDSHLEGNVDLTPDQAELAHHLRNLAEFHSNKQGPPSPEAKKELKQAVQLAKKHGLHQKYEPGAQLGEQGQRKNVPGGSNFVGKFHEGRARGMGIAASAGSGYGGGAMTTQMAQYGTTEAATQGHRLLTGAAGKRDESAAGDDSAASRRALAEAEKEARTAASKYRKTPR